MYTLVSFQQKSRFSICEVRVVWRKTAAYSQESHLVLVSFTKITKNIFKLEFFQFLFFSFLFWRCIPIFHEHYFTTALPVQPKRQPPVQCSKLQFLERPLGQGFENISNMHSHSKSNINLNVITHLTVKCVSGYYYSQKMLKKKNSFN